MLPPSRDAELVRQHRLFEREGYEGHRRHAGLTTMHRLAMRRARRTWRQRLGSWPRLDGAVFARA